MRIADALAESLLESTGKFSKKQLAQLRSQSVKTQKPIQDLIIQNGLMSEAAFTKLYAQEIGLPFVELPAVDISHHRVHSLLPEHVAQRYNAVVFDIDDNDNSILLAMDDPSDLAAVEFLRKQLSGSDVKLHVTTTSHIKNALDQYYAYHAQPLKFIDSSDTSVTEGDETDQADDNSVVARSVKHVVEQAIAAQASAIHIEPREDHVIIRYRIDGLLREEHKLPRSSLRPLVGRIKYLAKLKPSDDLTPQAGQWKAVFRDQNYSLQATTLPTVDGEQVVIHISGQFAEAIDLRKLGLWGPALHDLKKALTQPQGLVLVAGPNGSGKSTTLYSLLSVLNVPGMHLATIEDPVKYRINGANQVEVNRAQGTTFRTGLQAILKQDANVILISDISTKRVALDVVQAASNGHLVLGSIHTKDAVSGLRRLLDMGVESFLLSSTVELVVAQRLVRRLCTKCRKAIQPTPAALQRIERSFKLAESGGFHRLHELESLAIEEHVGPEDGGANAASSTSRTITRLWQASTDGCDECQHTGFKGRVGIFEVLTPTSDLQKLLAGGSTTEALREVILKAGVVSMQLDGLVKALRGQTTVNEVLRVISKG